MLDMSDRIYSVHELIDIGCSMGRLIVPITRTHVVQMLELTSLMHHMK